MSRRKSRLAQRRPIGNLSRLAMDVSKYGLNDAGERRTARNYSDLMRLAKQWRIDVGVERKRRSG